MARPLAIIIRFVVTLALIAGAVVFYKFLVATGPEPKQRPAPRHLPVVETMTLDAVDYRVKLPSQGIVEPRTETQLTAEVAGKVSRIDDAFLGGAAFEEGEILIELDDRDYRTALKRAQAALVQAKAALVQAEAETAKAREDWERLNLEGEPSDLALRLPQLREAEANVEAAEALPDRGALRRTCDAEAGRCRPVCWAGHGARPGLFHGNVRGAPAFAE